MYPLDLGKKRLIPTFICEGRGEKECIQSKVIKGKESQVNCSRGGGVRGSGGGE